MLEGNAHLLALGSIGLMMAFGTEAYSDVVETEPEKSPRCIPVARIIGYRVEADDLVRFELKGKVDVLAQLRRACPQLHYHNYISFQPVNGELCARIDDVVGRTGMPCRIESFTEVPRPTVQTISEPREVASQ